MLIIVPQVTIDNDSTSRIITARQRSCWKVMFSLVSVGIHGSMSFPGGGYLWSQIPLEGDGWVGGYPPATET